MGNEEIRIVNPPCRRRLAPPPQAKLEVGPFSKTKSARLTVLKWNVVVVLTKMVSKGQGGLYRVCFLIGCHVHPGDGALDDAYGFLA